MKQLSMLMLLVLSLSTVVFGGSLEPSTAPGPTMKTLDQVQPRIPITSVPYTISASGSYYLAANMTKTASYTGITVNADNVTIDLCGFTLTGYGNSGTGISCTSGNKNVEIRNGSIRGFNIGIAASVACDNWSFDNIRCVYNTCGISVDGTNAVFKNCQVCNNDNTWGDNNHGIYAGDNALVVDCSANNNDQRGISTGMNSVIINCTANSNGKNGILVKNRSRVSGCTTNSNGAEGVYADANCIVSDCVAGNNFGRGIMVNGNTTVSNCLLDKNYSSGIALGDNCTAIGNRVSKNGGNGILGALKCNVSGCVAVSNGSRGISVTDDSKVVDCTVSNNSSEGINAGDRCTVTGNNVTSNGITGIYCFGGYVARNNVMLNNTSATVGKGGIVVEKHSQVKENTLEGNAKNNIYVVQYRNSIEGNVMSGSDYGINFGSTGNVYRNNLATANGGNNVAGNTDGGGNNLAF